MESFRIVGRIVVDDETGPGVAQASQRIESVAGVAQRAGAKAGSALGRALQDGAGGGFLGVSNAAQQLSGVFGGLVELAGKAAVGGGLAAFGLREAAAGMAAMHAEMEALEGGMATLFSAQLGLPIEDALLRSRGLMRGLAQDAATGVGELADYATAASRVLGFANQAGKGDKDVQELTRNALAAGMALRGDEGLKTAGFDVTQALSGNVSDQETPIVAAALSAAGVSQKAFAKLDVAARFDTLNRAFGRFGAGVGLMGKGWDAQLSTLRDGLRHVGVLATRPIYDAWLERLRGANTWMSAHGALLDRVAGVVGGRLLGAWRGVEAVVDRVMGRVGGMEGLIGGVERLAAGEGPGWLRGLVSGGGALAAVSAMLGGVGKLGGLAEAFAGVAGLAGGGGAGVGVAGAAAGGAGIGLLAEGLALLLPLAVAAGGVFLAVSGAMGEFPAVTGFVGSSIDGLQKKFWPLVAAFGRLNQEGSILNRVGAGLMVVFGVFVRWNGLLLSLATGAVDLVGRYFLLLGRGFDFVFAKVWDLLASLGVANLRAPRASMPSPGDHAKLAADEEVTAEPARPPVAGKGNVVLTGPVHIEVKAERMDDPDRVAVAFDALIKRADRSKLQARRMGLAL